jgi:hypothetical protein
MWLGWGYTGAESGLSGATGVTGTVPARPLKHFGLFDRFGSSREALGVLLPPVLIVIRWEQINSLHLYNQNKLPIFVG